MQTAAGGSRVIDVSLSSWRQLFDSRDPSPFNDRDLDPQAAEYILDSFEDFGHEPPTALRLRVTKPDAEPVAPEVIRDAVHAHFAREDRRLRAKRRRSLQEGRATLAVCLVFLTACVTLAQTAATLASDAIAPVLRESLIILGWVAMWRPMDLLLYSWVPYTKEHRTLQALSTIPIDVAP